MAVPGLVFPFPVLVIGRRCKKFRRSISAPALVSENGRLRPEHFVTMRTRCRNAVGDEDPARLVFFFLKKESPPAFTIQTLPPLHVHASPLAPTRRACRRHAAHVTFWNGGGGRATAGRPPLFTSPCALRQVDTCRVTEVVGNTNPGSGTRVVLAGSLFDGPFFHDQQMARKA